MTELPQLRVAGRVLDANLHLFDRQLMDVDDVPIGVVDDIELTGVVRGELVEPGSPRPRIGALVANSGFWTRLFGGRPPSRRLHRVPWSAVSSIGTAIDLGVSGGRFDLVWSEAWVRDHVIARIPGGRDAPE